MSDISRREREKLMREDEIIDAAEKLFIHNGFDRASIDQIAQEAQFTRKTVYQHFANKEDIYIAVVAKSFSLLLCDMRQAKQNGTNGFEKLRCMGLAYYSFYKKDPDRFRLTNLIGQGKARAQDTAYFKEFNQIANMIAKEIADVIDEGKSDGSIRKDLHTQMATYSSQFLMTGFFSQLSLTGKTFTDHLSIDQETFVNFTLNSIFDLFRAETQAD